MSIHALKQENTLLREQLAKEEAEVARLTKAFNDFKGILTNWGEGTRKRDELKRIIVEALKDDEPYTAAGVKHPNCHECSNSAKHEGTGDAYCSLGLEWRPQTCVSFKKKKAAGDKEVDFATRMKLRRMT